MRVFLSWAKRRIQLEAVSKLYPCLCGHGTKEYYFVLFYPFTWQNKKIVKTALHRDEWARWRLGDPVSMKLTMWFWVDLSRLSLFPCQSAGHNDSYFTKWKRDAKLYWVKHFGYCKETFYEIDEGGRKEFTYKKESINTKFFPIFNFDNPDRWSCEWSTGRHSWRFDWLNRGTNTYIKLDF